PFCREIVIDRDDFMEVAPNRKFKRLVAGGEVRLRNAYVIRCDEVIKDSAGEVTELICSYDPDTLGKNPEGRKVKGVIHWVSARHGATAEVRLYDRLLKTPQPQGDTWEENLNPDSLITLKNAVVEPSLAEAEPGAQYQFEREGYFCRDNKSGSKLVFNRVVTLRDSWAKISST
ncbi:MAG: glutamine--tRNA ligase, partial [Gammaproteobacteria bacterium]